MKPNIGVPYNAFVGFRYAQPNLRNWYALFAGILGLVIVGTIGYSTARLGLVTALTIMVAAQFIAGAFLDHFGVLGADLRPLDLTRIFGIGLLLVGTGLVVR